MLTECAGQIHFDFVFFSFFAFDRKKNLSCRLFYVGSSRVTSKQISHQVCTLCPCDMRIWYVPAFCRSVWVFEVKFVLCGLPIESQKLAMCAVVSTVDFFCCILYVIKRLPEKCHCQSVFLTLNLRPCGKFGLPHLSKSTAAARTVQQSYLGV